MGIFSRSSSSGKHYKSGHNGSNHYKKGGLLGKVFNLISSRSSSHKHYNNNYNQNTSSHSSSTVNQNFTVCSKCNAHVPEGSKFCLQCGEKMNVSLYCGNCGKKLPYNAKFCLECGKKVSE